MASIRAYSPHAGHLRSCNCNLCVCVCVCTRVCALNVMDHTWGCHQLCCKLTPRCYLSCLFHREHGLSSSCRSQIFLGLANNARPACLHGIKLGEVPTSMQQIFIYDIILHSLVPRLLSPAQEPGNKATFCSAIASWKSTHLRKRAHPLYLWLNFL